MRGEETTARDLLQPQTIGSVVDRTNHWIEQGLENARRYLAGEITLEAYVAAERELVGFIHIETARGTSGDLLGELKLIRSFAGLRELHLRVGTLNLTLAELRRDLDRMLAA